MLQPRQSMTERCITSVCQDVIKVYDKSSKVYVEGLIFRLTICDLGVTGLE